MESIPGFRVDLTREEFLQQLGEIGLVLAGQTGDLAPADGKLYALRDVTGTVPSLPLIASSIMSKKIAAGAHRIVLDVKTGVGAFMQTVDQARELAEIMVEIGRLAGRKTAALLSDMNQPLGNAVGNALEVVEAIDTLQGNGPEDFRDHALEVAVYMLTLAERVDNVGEARKLAEDVLASGKAWEKFRELVTAQGGDVSYVDHPEKLPSARYVETVSAPQSGYLSEVNARIVGETSVALGAGREKKGQPIDYAVGIVVHHKVGDHVDAGQPLFTIHANQEEVVEFAREELLRAHRWSDIPVDPLPLFYEVVLEK
jgi:pyrimidine-nucleoside phosphorylase